MKVIIDIPEEEYQSILSYVQVYNSHYADMIRNGKPYEERPQGEWIRRKMNWYICSNCNHKTDSIGETFFNFCPNCGAKMQKGGTE